MIFPTPSSLSFPIDLAKALLAFSSKNKSQPDIFSIAIENGDLCATNGHSAVRFITGKDGYDIPNMVFPRPVVERALKLAAVDKTDVVLNFATALKDVKFPNLSSVDGREKIMSCTESVILNPSLFAALTLVAKACDIEEIQLIGLTAADEPVFIRVKGAEQEALVTGMPKLK